MDKQITVTMPVEEYERLKRIEAKYDDLIHSMEKCVEVQEVKNAHEVNLIFRTNLAVKLLAPYNDWDCDLEHFDKVIIQPYKG
ncbi:hypothetical protein [Lysinibacillus fusiformis]|uniref:hypothetical protein n=1 Tax=Lysinibacillus fusiformis TaxID=28031 RepID=UPI003CFD2EB0